MNQQYFGIRKATRPSITPIVVLLLIIMLILTFIALKYATVKETYVVKEFSENAGKITEKEYVRETTYRLRVKEVPARTYESAALETNVVFEQFGATIKVSEPLDPIATPEAPEKAEPEIMKHFPESTYIKGAILVHGEAGGVSSITERSGVLWTPCNRVLSPNYPNDLEAVIEQPYQFDGYTVGGYYTQADYDLAVDVFERFYRELNGETAVEVGRTLPAEYIYFTGDGQHNHFTITQYGAEYVWGSQLISPYKN